MSDVRLLAEWFPEFAEQLDKLDETYKEMKTIDEKTYQFICFALAIKTRSRPCLLKHFMGGIVAMAACILLGITIGVLIFRRISTVNQPIIDRIVKTRLEITSTGDDKCLLEKPDSTCDGCTVPFL